MEDEDERNRKDDEDKLLDELAAQGMHKNLSFFAFTATPKGKTLQLFGQKDAEGIYRPFHYLFHETGNRGAFHFGCSAELYDLQNVL